MSLLDLDLRPLIPMFKVVSDLSKLMLKDDQKDLAFPTRYHRGMFHHYHWGLLTFPFAELAMQLIDIHEIIKREKYHKTDTPGTFLTRVVAIHNKTYVPSTENQENRVELITQYMDQLKGERNKKGIERKLHNAIYMGKIKTTSQIEEEKRLRIRKKSTHPKPPRINKPRASQGNIVLSKPNRRLN